VHQAGAVKLARLAALPLALVALGAATVAGDTTTGCSHCKTLPALSASDLSCNSDDDCAVVWSGTICCGCNCADTAANAATQARLQSELSSELNCGTTCDCPGTVGARCFAHQCTLCGNPAFGPIPGQPAECSEDAGTGDAPDEAAPDGPMAGDR
jgi:hypothetical protein